MADGRPVAAPAEEGLDSNLICAIGASLENMKEAAPNGVLVARHGALVYEHYTDLRKFLDTSVTSSRCRL